MLILERESGQSIVIGDDIVITVFAPKGTPVQIGVDTPQGIEARPSEVFRKLKELKSASKRK